METTRSIDHQDLAAIHFGACRTVAAIVHQRQVDVEQWLGELAAAPISGLYVTLKRGDTLRGCCGWQGTETPLATALIDSATRTAKHDPRMAPITPIELPHLNLSISILESPRTMIAVGADRADELKVGTHGLRIRMGNKAGLLLPVVARERNWNSHQFLDAVCIKAGLPPGSWLSDQAEIEIFEGIDYGAPMILEDHVESESDPGLFSGDDLVRLRSWIQSNIVAFQSGATPAYYANGVPDHSVAGIVLRVAPDPNQAAIGWMQLSIQDGMPGQATILKMTEIAARSLMQHSWTDGWRADVSVLSSLIHHGNDREHDLREVRCANRALLALEGRKWSIGFDGSASQEDLLRQTLAAQTFRSQLTQIYSARCDTTENHFAISSAPEVRARVSTRPPAVAGTFYPADDKSRVSMVDSLLSGLEQVARGKVAAAMVPHAGLRFSGRIAADVLRRIELPETVLIIGPKHTPDGADWAVAPHDVWRISDAARLAGDIELANRIAEVVPGMELDAAAHQREHGIEVQLPLLHRISPDTKVAAIAMSAASYDELQAAAESLAECLSSLDKPPLMIISSDMNHFADDQENRRRDRLALDQLKLNDPRGLLETCARENISMCGQVPAALVLLTLRVMGIAAKYTEIAYATSADVTGDKSRVVGYAGLLF